MKRNEVNRLLRRSWGEDDMVKDGFVIPALMRSNKADITSWDITRE